MLIFRVRAFVVTILEPLRRWVDVAASIARALHRSGWKTSGMSLLGSGFRSLQTTANPDRLPPRTLANGLIFG